VLNALKEPASRNGTVVALDECLSVLAVAIKLLRTFEVMEVA
jgi:hypothetical protein